MSRLFPDHLLAYLGPNELVISRVASRLSWRGIQRQVVARTRIEHGCGEHIGTACQSASDALFAALSSQVSPAPRTLTIVLSHAFVRFLMVPWQPRISSAAEENAYLAILFSRSYGTKARDWSLAVDDVPPRPVRVACAIDASLLATLRAQAATHKLTLCGCSPYLAHRFEQVRRLLANADGWLVTVESGTWCFALVVGGYPVSVRARPAPVDWEQHLVQALDREAHLVDCPAQVAMVYLSSVAAVHIDRFPSVRWQFVLLPHAADAIDIRCNTKALVDLSAEIA